MATKYKGKEIHGFKVIDGVSVKCKYFLVVKCVKCGEYTAKRYEHILNGKAKCECQRKRIDKNGLSNTKIGNAYYHMIRRCYRESSQNYYLYGSRGIKVCDEWLGKSGFINFYNWSIENGFKDGLTLDRIDVNGNYEPDNCRWTTPLKQANNRRNNVILEFNGEKKTLAEWSRKIGINSQTLRNRLNRGWSVERALTEEIKIHNKSHSI